MHFGLPHGIHAVNGARNVHQLNVAEKGQEYGHIRRPVRPLGIFISLMALTYLARDAGSLRGPRRVPRAETLSRCSQRDCWRHPPTHISARGNVIVATNGCTAMKAIVILSPPPPSSCSERCRKERRW
jgi:hypothetical protein